jgi:hypothetical protein
VRAAREGVTQAPDDLADQRRPELRHPSLEGVTAAHQGQPDQDRQPPAVHVGNHAGRDLEDEAHDLQHGPDQDHLQRIQSDDGGVVDELDGEEEREADGLDEGQDEVDPDRVG